jgi:hypothetical protein
MLKIKDKNGDLVGVLKDEDTSPELTKDALDRIEKIKIALKAFRAKMGLPANPDYDKKEGKE